MSASYFSVPETDNTLRLRTPRSSAGIEKDLDRATSEFLDTAEKWLSTTIPSLDNPGIRVELGLPRNANLTRGYTLHLYAEALADRIKETNRRGTYYPQLSKAYRDVTVISAGSATIAEPPLDTVSVTIRTRRSYAGNAFREEVYDATHKIRAIATNAKTFRLNLSFVTGLPRTWSRLWAPTVNGLFDRQGFGGHARDARIVELGLEHRSAGEALGHNVQITLSASGI